MAVKVTGQFAPAGSFPIVDGADVSGNITGSNVSASGQLEAGSLGTNLASIISGSTPFNAAAVSGSLGANASLIRSLTATGISGSTPFDASDVSGSWRGELSSSAMTVVGGGVSGSSTSTGSFGHLYTAGGGVTAGTILPSADNSYDLGSLTNRFANLYVGDLLLSNKSRGGNEVDGTYGDYTIQEGEEDLFLLNNRSGKTYRFKLEEVDAKPWYKKIFS